MSKFCQKIACCIVIPSIPGRFYPSSTATQKKKKAEKILTLPSQPLHSTTYRFNCASFLLLLSPPYLLTSSFQRLLNTEYSILRPVVNCFFEVLRAKIGLDFVSFLFSLCSQMLASFQLCPRKVKPLQYTLGKNILKMFLSRIPHWPPRPSEANRGQQRPTEANRGQHRQTEVNRCKQLSTEAKRDQQRPTEINRGQQRPTDANRGQQRPTKAKRGQKRLTEANRGQQRPLTLKSI